MALSNSQHDVIMRVYNQEQLKNEYEQDERVRRVHGQIPQIHGSGQKISARAVQCARRLLDGNENAKEGLKQQIRDLREQKEILLKSVGFPKDYMEMHYPCPDCQDTGYISEKKCHCFKQKQIKLLYAQSNVDKIIEMENLDAFFFEYFDNREIVPGIQMTVADYMRQVLGWCREFVDNSRTEGGNLIFTESTGAEKAFLANRTARELIQVHQSIIHLSANDLFDVFSKNKFNYELKLETQDMYQYILDCDLLIIGDLGTELNNTFVLSQLFYYISRCLLRKKGTIISTNLSVTILWDMHSNRISSRIMSQYVIIPLYGDDIRTKKHWLAWLSRHIVMQKSNIERRYNTRYHMLEESHDIRREDD